MAVTIAQERLKELADWIKASSQPRRAPLGKEWIMTGPYAVIVPSDLDAPPVPASFNPAALPIFVPASQAEGLSVPDVDGDLAASIGDMAARPDHLLWCIPDRFKAVAVPLTNPQEALQVAIDRAGAGGVDMAVLPILCVPVWALKPDSFTLKRFSVLPQT